MFKLPKYCFCNIGKSKWPNPANAADTWSGENYAFQPMNINQLPKYGFSERNTTNHVTRVFVQALNSNRGL